jgi:arylformamidase
MGVHNASHADAPFHFQKDGIGIDRMPLDIYFGDALVVDLSEKFSGAKRDEITIGDLELNGDALRSAGRLLLKTSVWKDSTHFPDWIPVIAAEVPQWLQERKVKLLGIDLPSVDPIEAKVLRNHHALAGAGIAIVESLDLSAVDAGTYYFSALPLRIQGGDAGPVRAIVWQD